MFFKLISVLIVALFAFGNGYSQSIKLPDLPPVVASNSGSSLYHKLKKSQDFTIIYSPQAYWEEDPYFSVLTLKKGKWTYEEWEVQRKKEKEKLKRVLSRPMKNTQEINKLMNYWASKNFFRLDNQQLNKTTERVDGTTTNQYYVEDCGSSCFELFTPDTYQPLYSKCPEVFQSKIPNDDRARFIECATKFQEFLAEVDQAN